MSILEILLIGIGLAMDAFAVSICKGLSMKEIKINKILIIGLYFGIFQSIMPIIGFLLGKGFENLVILIDHWIAFSLLLLIGINMIKETFEDTQNINEDISIKTMTLLGIATSIDALTIGLTFAFLRVNIIKPAILIGVITFILSMIGVIIGNKVGNKIKKKAQILGGVILIGIGTKILIEHLFF